jgi:UDP-N-acetylmuramoyl-L-alanyl-D-glutamate--2,6-diaminopimelate ligase
VNIKTNSKEVVSGDTFIAIKGLTHDGHDYIDGAIKRGATKIIAEHGNYEVETIIVDDTKKYLIDYLHDTYYDKIKELKLIGITGTNGKTTSCFLIYQILNKSNISCAYIGTIGYYLKDNVIKLNNTTPDIIELYSLLLKCYEEGIKYVVMEVSSHALELKRVAGLEYDYAVFTNLTVDHLDFHHNLNDYAKSKEKLFHMLKDTGIAIINNDDEYKNMMMVHKHNITYGFNDNSDYQITYYQTNNEKTSFTFKYKDNLYSVDTYLLGKFNIYNLLTMIIIVHNIGISLPDIINKIPILKAPPGRMDTIVSHNKTIIIDYAHTPDAVFNVLNTIKEFSKGKIYSIIGCGGDRDKTKRGKMTFYATSLSDNVIITSDNPRFEDPRDIIDDMIENQVKKNYEIVIDRKDAIKRGHSLLKENDILVILGKGHEDYQIIGNEKIYHNDKEYVLSLCE